MLVVLLDSKSELNAEQSGLSLLSISEGQGQGLMPYRAEVKLGESDATLLVSFEAGGYPRISFPCPDQGWDLSAYRGIELEVTNLEKKPVRCGLRVDNPGDEAEHFWNTETRLLEPGKTVKIRSVFGQNNGRPAYRLDASRITAYQFFLISPKEAVAIRLGEPRAYGVASEEQSRRFSEPEDRQRSIEPEDWLGDRPPVKGDWVQTLNEDFETNTLNDSVWSTRLAMIGPPREETQRYRDENVVVADGQVSLIVEQNPGHQYDDPTLPERDLAAGMLSSYDLWKQQYGYFEIRAKMPTAIGLGPTLSLIPDRGAESGLNMHERRTSHDFNGQGMEMDVVYHLTEWGAGRVGISTRWGGPAGTHIQKQWGDRYVYHGPTNDGWHTYGMLWEPDRLVWYIDGIKKGEWHSDAIANVPCYILVTMPMGKLATKEVALEQLPTSWDIDYIRVWQQADRVTLSMSE
ncbi:glycoside hydrolase family 16 protein [Rubellicoccus peritrichatus]|uniref:Glycoside hydrolase family 16 protein n=1 Tax=Rubellicoccus peritrichatus TaxID=3080537 RepID=A0AAQ3QU49_9BACT|nr:glycoside hydrolase family 16 protein [Puniceicoccus sp. CR14]WOO40098.1 glycoside hydrolase family 16 protein [Puniceicoccus sp. CR14]